MIKNLAVKLMLAFSLPLLVLSCVKNDDFFSRETDERSATTLIKFVGGGGEPIQRARDVDPAIDTFLLVELRRDVRNESDINQSLTVKLANDTGVIGRYNRAHNTSFEQLPANLYTLLTDVGNITFAPGEISKLINIRLNKANMDLSKQYAIGLSVTDPGTGAQTSNAQGEVLVAVGVKNKYDGRYRVNGTMTDFANAALTGSYPWDVELRTSGPNSVTVWDVENNAILHPILNAGAPSYYGSFGVQLTFDPVTNKVISVVNTYGQPAANGRSAELDPSGANMWDANTGDIQVKYWMNQPSVIAGHRVSFDETFEYQGPR